MDFTDPSMELERMLDQLPAGGTVGIADPSTVDRAYVGAVAAGEVTLGVGIEVGAADSAALRLLDATAAAGAAALVLATPVSGSTRERVRAQAELDRAAARQQLRLVWKPASVSWRELHAALLAHTAQPVAPADDELADLAQTIAVLTGGLVTIEDTSSRVLAYSRSSDEVDELRRLSILGRSGPPDYLALLREWGVYDRLSAAEEVVEIAEHPASGVRRRLAVGVFAGRRQLATIWVQQGSSDFGPHAKQALLGAARLTAAQLVSRPHRRTGPGAGHPLADLLAGRTGPGPLSLGRDAERPCAVALLSLAARAADTDRAERVQQLDELGAIVTVHAAAFRRQTVVEPIEDLLAVLLPNLDATTGAQAMLGRAVSAARSHLDPDARAVLGVMVASTADAARSVRTARLALSVPSDQPVLTFAQARNRLITRRAHDVLQQEQDLVDPRVSELIAADPASADTLLRYLDTGSNVGRVAADLGVHPTTVRYRIRRTTQTVGIDLADPDDRLSTQLQLRHGLRS